MGQGRKPGLRLTWGMVFGLQQQLTPPCLCRTDSQVASGQQLPWLSEDHRHSCAPTRTLSSASDPAYHCCRVLLHFERHLTPSTSFPSDRLYCQLHVCIKFFQSHIFAYNGVLLCVLCGLWMGSLSSLIIFHNTFLRKEGGGIADIRVVWWDKFGVNTSTQSILASIEGGSALRRRFGTC